VLDEAFNAAEAFCEREDAAPLQQASQDSIVRES